MDESVQTWAPILEGRLLEDARNAILAVAGELALQMKPDWAQAGSGHDPSNPNIAGGSAGIALLFAEIAETGLLDGAHDDAVEWTNQAITDMSRQVVNAGLLTGVAGVAWTADRVARRWDTLSTDDPNDETDSFLLEWLESHEPNGVPHDLTDGLVGIGVYVAGRIDNPVARKAFELTLDFIAYNAEHAHGGAFWRSVGRFAGNPFDVRFGLGPAHGASGVIALLALAASLDVQRGRSAQLAEQGVTWLLAQKREHEDLRGHFFPHAIGEDVVGERRLSWCWGEPGIAAALMLAGESMSRSDWRDEAVATARAICENPKYATGFADSCLCHGTSGLGHILNRFYQATGDVAFADGARRCFARVLDTRSDGEGIGGFQFMLERSDRTLVRGTDPGFLNGSAGVAAALLAATTAGVPAWNRLFLIA